MSKSKTYMGAPGPDYTGPITVDPVTRIEGHLKIEVEVENGVIKDAWSSAQLFRGLEIILKGRDPRDAQHFTQRTCGVCTYVHAHASTRSVEDAVGVGLPANANIIRNLMMSMQYLHDHIVHFYHLHALDFVDVQSALSADPAKAAKIANSISPRKTTADELRGVRDKLKKFVDSGQLGIFTNAYFLGGHPAYQLPAEVNLIATAHYLEALNLQCDVARATAVFGSKNPHLQTLVVGGVTCYDSLSDARLQEFTDLYEKTKKFVKEVYLPDLLAIAGYYKDVAGYGGTDNFLSFGDFRTDDKDIQSAYFEAGVVMNRDLGGTKKDFDPSVIDEHVAHSWYEGDTARHPYEGETKPAYTDYNDRDRYTWLKAPRYNGEPMEVGPLSRVLIGYARGNQDIVKAVDMVLGELGVDKTALFSTLGRTAARCIESVVLLDKTEEWLNQLKGNVKGGDNTLVSPWEMPSSSKGVGYSEAPRGALSHWIVIEDKKIKNFQLVVPSTWTFGPRCAAGKRGPVEQSLIGTPVADASRPVEILRTVHSFDPCIACGVHVIDGRTNQVHKFKVL